MAMRIVAGAVMPSAMRIAAPCYMPMPSPDHAGWAMPGAEQRAEDAALFIRLPLGSYRTVGSVVEESGFESGFVLEEGLLEDG